MPTRFRVALVLALSLPACSTDGERPSVDAGSEDALPESSTSLDGAHLGLNEGGQEAGPEAGAAPYPLLLSETGLFTDVPTETLAPGVRPFQPKYALWSDGATKRRWIYLPEGAQIDTSDMDYWQYPVGTKVWKEFTLGSVRVETRLQYKAGPSKTDWVMIAYQWRSDLRNADAVPAGVPDARGTTHDIPSTEDCLFCHGNMKDSLLGVSALQLSHSLTGVTLTDLVSENRLSSPPSAPFTIPGDPTAEGALGYLHANCGTCHNPASDVYALTGLRLWESTGALDTVENTTAYRTTVGQPNGALPQFHVIEPGDPDRSELVLRMSVRGTASPTQMPPLATEVVDTAGVAKVRAWIESLPPLPFDAGDAGGADAAPTDAGIQDAAVDGG